MTLPYTPAEAAAAHAQWNLHCGHFAIASATGRSLEKIHQCGVPIKGWMSPTMIRATLGALKVKYTIQPLGPNFKVNTPVSLGPLLQCLDFGLGMVIRLQWEGSWLNPGVHAGAAYARTHYIASKNGCILDPAHDPNVWLSIPDWLAIIQTQILPNIKRATGWHFTHIWSLEKPGKDALLNSITELSQTPGIQPEAAALIEAARKVQTGEATLQNVIKTLLPSAKTTGS